jgi:hypothetical protein
MVTAVAATLDEFGIRVESGLDAMGLRIESLADIVEQVVATVEDLMSRRRGASTEAITLLRQVAAEAANEIAADNDRRRQEAG